MGGRGGALAVRERRERRHLRRDRAACERVVEGARREGLVLLGDPVRLLRLADRGDARHRRRRVPHRPDDRRDDLQRPLPGRRDDDVPGGRAGRRPVRRPPHRRRHEARPRVRAAEDLQGQAPPPPAPRAPARQHRHRGRRGAAPDRARRRAAGNDARALRDPPARAATARSRDAPRAPACAGYGRAPSPS